MKERANTKAHIEGNIFQTKIIADEFVDILCFYRLQIILDFNLFPLYLNMLTIPVAKYPLKNESASVFSHIAHHI